MSDSFENLRDDVWDAELAADLVGATLLVGLTYLDSEDRVSARKQVFGRVVSCDAEDGIAISVSKTGETFVIAPVMDAIEPGDPGIYQMTDSDEVVTDPDFIALLTVTSPPLA